MSEILKFDLPKNQSSIIKVIGVGGGGSNAVTHMFNQGIVGVDFIICNTDAQAMESSPVPTKIQLGANLTSGLGAGAVPSVGRNAALENAADIRAILDKGTKMLFITAGLGGGTGTGAAPVIAQISKELDILTVGIVTIPFAFEGRKRKQYAEEGLQQLKKQVDALLIISNDKLRELCGDLRLSAAFKKADNVLTTAAKGIAEIITVTGHINVDFEDVKTVMRDSGVALLGTGVAGGENRALHAVEEALSSPLLDNNDIEGANNLLLYISSGTDEITMDEVTEITDYIQGKTKSSAEVIWGTGTDENLADNISVTIIATGFDPEHRQKDPARPQDVKVHELYGQKIEPKLEKRFIEPRPFIHSPVTEEKFDGITLGTPQPETMIAEPLTVEPELAMETSIELSADTSPRSVEFTLENPQIFIQPETIVSETVSIQSPELVNEVVSHKAEEPEPYIRTQPSEHPSQDDHDRRANERVNKLRALSEKLKNHTPIDPSNIYELEVVPAYKRRNVDLLDVTPSSEPSAPTYSLGESADKSIEIRSENSFLHKNVD
ncbi:MAG: cell division protein FtsZ [Bacteroidetes bacterium]|nr:cell division protein FtsZ [Bacteroidota bacterium]